MKLKLTPAELLDLINVITEQTNAERDFQQLVAKATQHPKQDKDFSTRVFDLQHAHCNQILTALAGAGICTPEETYGFDIGWAVKDACTAISNLDTLATERKQQLECAQAIIRSQEATIEEMKRKENQAYVNGLHDGMAGQKGWRIPQRGQKVMVCNPPEAIGYPESIVKAGDILTVHDSATYVTTLSPVIAQNGQWPNEVGVLFQKKGMFFNLPIRCIEPVTEPAAMFPGNTIAPEARP